MVYRKNTLKVLLGPAEKYIKQNEGGEDPSPDDTHLYIKSAGVRKPADHADYGKIGETNVFKKARPYQPVQVRPKLERYPSGLQLSGQRVDTEDAKTKSARSAAATKHNTTPTDLRDTPEELDTMPRKVKAEQPSLDAPYTPSFQKPRHARGTLSASNTVSKYFLTDFGLQSQRTDTFSGHNGRRGVASAEMERQIQEKADRHIRTCQTMGHVKRSSKAQIGYQGLRDAVSPRHSPMTLYSQDGISKTLFKDKSFFGEHTTSAQKANAVPYMIQIRKHIGSIARTKSIAQNCQQNDPLPEISGRTLIAGSAYV